MTIKDRITESWLTPLVALAVLLTVWALRGGSWVGLPGVFVLTLGLRRLAVENALVRVRTWLPMSVFMLLVAVPGWLQSVGWWQLVALCYGLSLYFLMASYESRHAERLLLLSGLWLGVACVVYPSLLLLVLVYLISMSVHLQVFSRRSLAGFVLGLLVPLELWTAACMIFARWDLLRHWIGMLGEIGFVGSGLLPLEVGLTVLFWVVLFATAAIHYVMQSFNDKIRTRMCLYILILQSAVLFVLLFLQAGHCVELSAMLALCLSPLMGHYVALSEGRWNAVWLCVLGVFYVAMLCVPGAEASEWLYELFGRV